MMRMYCTGKLPLRGLPRSIVVRITGHVRCYPKYVLKDNSVLIGSVSLNVQTCMLYLSSFIGKPDFCMQKQRCRSAAR